MSYGNNLTFEDVKRENNEELRNFIELIDFNFRTRNNDGENLELYSNKQFSKGFNRLKIWLDLAYKSPPVYIDKNNKEYTVKELNVQDSEAKIYALTGLIVIFQVFGDANHRTSNEYFKKYTGKSLTHEQMEFINDIMRTTDFYNIINNSYPPSVIGDIAERLMSKYQHMSSSQSIRDNGEGAGATPEMIRNIQRVRPSVSTSRSVNKKYGGKKTKRKNVSKKSRKTKRTKKHKKRGKKSKTNWDSSIISPIFFGYSTKK